MIELLMLLIAPSEINPQKLGMKYVLKQKFVDYQTCEEYVVKNTYSKPGEQKFEGVFYKIKELLKNNTLKNMAVINLIKFINKISYLFFFQISNKLKLLKLYKDQKEFPMTSF